MIVARRFAAFLPRAKVKMPISPNHTEVLRYEVDYQLKLTFPFCSQQSEFKGLSQSQPKQPEVQLVSVEELSNSMCKDIAQNCINYRRVHASFLEALQTGKFSQQNISLLIDCLNYISQYPLFALGNSHTLAIYRLICHNMHLKSVEEMNQMLTFVVATDPELWQSPVYHEFIRFYLQNTTEQYRIKFQIDFDKLSLWQVIKQLTGRVTQRGFFPRSPPYTRNLNILHHRQILHKLAVRKDGKDALMLKKLNYTIFMEIKTFYQQKMRENLYHSKKVHLMRMFQDGFMEVLSMELPQVYHESIHLRQLYMKLYITLPEQNEEKDSSEYSGWVFGELKKLKSKNVVWLYNLACKHIESMNHLKLDEIEENIGVVIEFVQKVERNFQEAAFKDIIDPEWFGMKESFLIMDLLNSLKLQQQSLYDNFSNKMKTKINFYNFKCYFPYILNWLQKLKNIEQLSEILTIPDNLSLLSLVQLSQLCNFIGQAYEKPLQNIWASLYKNILQKVLETDFQVIGGKQILLLLKMYQKSLIFPKRQLFEQNAQVLRIFLMRYLADHHKQLKVKELEEILSTLFQLPNQTLANFDDEDGNYTVSILEQMSPYLSKIDLILDESIRRELAARRFEGQATD